jgi:hypothetical protein
MTPYLAPFRREHVLQAVKQYLLLDIIHLYSKLDPFRMPQVASRRMPGWDSIDSNERMRP